MSDHEKPQPDEEFQSGEMNEEDLEHVVAASSSFDLNMNNESNDRDNSQVEIFQKPAAT